MSFPIVAHLRTALTLHWFGRDTARWAGRLASDSTSGPRAPHNRHRILLAILRQHEASSQGCPRRHCSWIGDCSFTVSSRLDISPRSQSLGMDSSMVLAQGPWRVVGRRRRNAQHGSGEYNQFMSLRSRCIPGVLVGDRLAQDSRDVEIRDIRDRLCRNPH